MKIQQNEFQNLTLSYPLEKAAPLESVLFLDIETTGFTAVSSHLYMIGCAYFKDKKIHSLQWFAESYEEEEEILKAFLDFSAMYRYMIHFNGNNFDLPYLASKCEQLDLPNCLDGFEGIDLYRRISPCKKLLKLENCKQKTLEEFLGIHREDAYSGGDLIGIYHDYVTAPDAKKEEILFAHNRDDIMGMIQLLPLLTYSDLLLASDDIRAKKVQANTYKDLNGSMRRELLITVTLPCTLPHSVSAADKGCSFRGEKSDAVIKVPVYDGELKYFYSGYKDYYYLPEEDIALHKSVAGFVDPGHREQATASNCYTRKESSYLPEWDGTFEPYFKKSYADKELFFEMTDEMKRDRDFFARYAVSVLKMLVAS